MNRLPRVLQVYNEYRRYGGEDAVVHLEAEMLRKNGHAVELLRVSTRDLERAGPLRLAAAGLGAVWSFRGYFAMTRAIGSFSPDIVHVHNEFPLLSPSIFWACHRAGVPVVQTMHNYRFACANSLLLRKDQPCEDCIGRFPWPALRHRCYGSSMPRTASVVARNVFHRRLGTYRNKVHAYIALTDFSKERLVRAGLPQQRVFVKPNFQPAPAQLVLPRLPRLVCAGGMYRFKGLHVLLQAWKDMGPSGHQLLLVGDGPERSRLEPLCGPNSGVAWCGAQPREKVIELVAASRFVVVPSLAYENFPMAVLEALSVGTPVIVPNHGAFAAIISDGREGLHFSAGDADSLQRALGTALAAPETLWSQWSANARSTFAREYTEQANYAQLMVIYENAVSCFQEQRSHIRRGKLSNTPVSATRELRGDS